MQAYQHGTQATASRAFRIRKTQHKWCCKVSLSATLAKLRECVKEITVYRVLASIHVSDVNNTVHTRHIGEQQTLLNIFTRSRLLIDASITSSIGNQSMLIDLNVGSILELILSVYELRTSTRACHARHQSCRTLHSWLRMHSVHLIPHFGRRECRIVCSSSSLP